MRACAMNELLQCGGLTFGNMRGLLIRVDFLTGVDGNKCSLNCAMTLTGNNIRDREETKRTSVPGLPGIRTIHSAITTLAHKFSPRNATYGSFKAKNKEFFARLIFHPAF